MNRFKKETTKKEYEKKDTEISLLGGGCVAGRL